ncbi:RecT family recombinase [Erwinia phyllosphaerae]|uniref:RecT family recombinase n=1 Tax=Erwinia phyllosphaerae TaxID=2853256 RepID=UPI001FEF369B|nr:RecT family recombinase [Erwinia phyllosphaerae]MBV4366252.1 recombinase RecT [Erwinia phyllosphaerae]
MNEITTAGNNAVRTIDNVSILTNGDLFNRLQVLANVMANSGEMVPAHYRGKPETCMATAMQAARWGMDPFAVAQKTHIVSGTLGYEAQLVNAVITTMAPTKDRLHYDWFGLWENVIGKFVEKTSSKGNKYIAPGWSLADEKGVGVKVWATLRGEDTPRELTLYLSQAQVRNSTLWASDPRQQLAYLAVKRWARLYCPDVILGVYSDDELGPRVEKDITPAADRVVLSELASAAPPAEPVPTKSTSETPTAAAAPEPAAQSAEPEIAQQLREGIQKADTPERATELRKQIEDKKDELGISLYTELKNKAVQRFYRLNAMAEINAKFDELSPNSPDAAAHLKALITLINKSKRHLDSAEFQRFSVAANDMRAEYGV